MASQLAEEKEYGRDIEAGGFPDAVASSEESNHSNIVDWNGPDDPEYPMNWSSFARYGTALLVSVFALLTSLGASMWAPGVPDLMAEFHSANTELAAFVVSVYVLGFAAAPLVFAPLSELYGRLYLYYVCMVFFIIFNVGCALSKNFGAIIVFRFLSGCAGSAPLAIGGGTISDLVPQEQRGAFIAVYVMGPLVGPVAGPIAGGFLSDAEGWRWNFWVVSIAAGVLLLAFPFFLRETYPPVLLQRKTERLRKETRNPDLVSKFDTGRSPSDLFNEAIIRPVKLLFRSPIVFLLSLYTAVSFGYLFLLFTTFTEVFEEQYGFSGGVAGLSYLGLGTGMIMGTAIFRFYSDAMLKSLAAKEGGQMKPEMRLPLMIAGAPLLPVGFFWYGWSAQEHTHWIVPILGTSFIGIGLVLVMMPVMTYLLDAFPTYAASALSANTVLRSLFATVIPLFGLRMYDAMGLGWGNSLLGFIALAFLPVPLFFYRYGERIRTNYPVRL